MGPDASARPTLSSSEARAFLARAWSVIHQVAIRTATAAIRVISGLEGSKLRNRVTKNRMGPNKRPIL